VSFLPNPRYERKFGADGFSLSECVALVRRHPALFREVYPSRMVNNVYLDSPTRTAYHDHLNGASVRLKHRVRWYGPLNSLVPGPVLERKFKSGLISGKDAHTLPDFRLNGLPLESTLTAVFDQARLPERLRNELRHLTPCLVNRYCRRYFLSADGRFRLTVDSDFRFGPVRGTPVEVSAAVGVPRVVLELKFEAKHADQAEALTNALPMRLKRCSKFILGVEQLHA
jgi:hypothetical protein